MPFGYGGTGSGMSEQAYTFGCVVRGFASVRTMCGLTVHGIAVPGDGYGAKVTGVMNDMSEWTDTSEWIGMSGWNDMTGIIVDLQSPCLKKEEARPWRQTSRSDCVLKRPFWAG